MDVNRAFFGLFALFVLNCTVCIKCQVFIRHGQALFSVIFSNLELDFLMIYEELALLTVLSQ